MSYFSSAACFVGIYFLGVLSTFMLTGLVGLFSFGQAAFMAIAAYVSGLCAIRFDLPFAVALAAGVVASTLIALVVGAISLRLGRDHFALATFVFGEATKGVINTAIGITGGALGLVGIPQITTLPMVLVTCLIFECLTANLKRSRIGLVAMSIRDDEVAAQTMGVNIYSFRLKVFLFSAAIASTGGVLLAFMTTYVEPSMFSWMRSAEWIIIVFFGGKNSLLGTTLAGLLLLSFPELARFGGEWRTVIYCIIVLVIINFMPEGLLGVSARSI